MKALRISHAFAARVSKSVIPDYYDIVKDPVCIEDIHTSGRTQFNRRLFVAEVLGFRGWN